MADYRIENLARTLVNYSVRVKEGDRVGIGGSVAAEALIREVGREVLRAGGHPVPMLALPGWEYLFLSEASENQLKFTNPFFKMAQEEFEGYIHIHSDLNTRERANIPPETQAVRARAFAPVMETYMRRSAEGEFRWVLTIFPTPALAQDAEMALEEFEEFVYRATFADQADPIAAWQKVHDDQQKLVDWLRGKREVVAKGPNVDLKVSIEGRPFRNSDGDRNMPSGEIFTSPVEDSVEGWYRGSFPAINGGQEVLGVELNFEAGRVVEAKAERNESYLQQMLDLDDGSRVMGEFAIGTNMGIQKFTRNILFDEKMGGTMHIALGSGFPELGSQNTSGLHWDIITEMRDGGQIFVDDELFYDSGKFVVLGG
jgi:aminopeptidase